jgi:hypothetical protein
LLFPYFALLIFSPYDIYSHIFRGGIDMDILCDLQLYTIPKDSLIVHESYLDSQDSLQFFFFLALPSVT